MKLPLADLNRQYQAYKTEIDEAMAAVIAKGAFIGSASFEKAFADYVGMPHCIGVGNGTDALHCALWGLGVGPGDEVLVPSMTFVASAEPIVLLGARPVFVEIDPQTYTLDLADAERKCTAKTKVILPVHLYGQSADMSAVLNLAKAKQLKVLEDCAQSHGALHRGQQTGSWGDLSTFSFYPGKNIGAFGDGGAILCKDQALAQRIRMYANHGRSGKYDHTFVGINSRLDGLQGAILAVKLKHIAEIIAGRRRVAALYRKELAVVSQLTLPYEDPAGLHVYHLFVLQTEKRDALLKHLNEQGIGAGVHYPAGCHEQPAFAAYKTPLLHTEALSRRALSLPIFPELSDDEARSICACVRQFFR